MPKATAKRRRPSQTRSAFTVDAILQGASELLVDRGARKLTTNAIAERSGVSIGTLYQYFANKEAIVDALRLQHGTDVLHALGTAAQTPCGAKAEDVLTKMIRANVDAHLKNPRLHRVLTVDNPKLTVGPRGSVCPYQAAHQALFADTESRFADLLPHLDRERQVRPMLAGVFGLVEAMTHALVVDCPSEASAHELERIIFASSQACMDQFVRHEAMTRPF
ncbi:MAG: TetR/AcrR family transcriptional regulator [Pseudomonadota bacterium]